MRDKPKAKAKRPAAASREAGKVRATRVSAPVGAARSKPTSAKAGSTKSQAVKSRLKGAKTVAAVVKSKTVAKASTAKVAKRTTLKAEKPVVATRAVSVRKSLPIKTRKPKTPLLAAKEAKFSLGQVVKHRIYAFRGVVFDIDPVFANTEDWWLAIPADVRPRKDQPFYHLLAENEETEYIAYVSEQNLIADTSGQPLRHPQLQELFVEDDEGRLRAVFMQPN